MNDLTPNYSNFINYPYTIKRVKTNSRLLWIAESSVLKGCVGRGTTIGEALSELSFNESEWLKTAKEENIPIPDVPIEDWDEEKSNPDFPSLRTTPQDLETLLQVCFGCNKSFLNEPKVVGKELDGNETVSNFTLEGAKAYDKLVACIYAISAMGVFSETDAERYIKELDSIASENGAYAGNV